MVSSIHYEFQAKHQTFILRWKKKGKEMCSIENQNLREAVRHYWSEAILWDTEGSCAGGGKEKTIPQRVAGVI